MATGYPSKKIALVHLVAAVAAVREHQFDPLLGKNPPSRLNFDAWKGVLNCNSHINKLNLNTP